MFHIIFLLSLLQGMQVRVISLLYKTRFQLKVCKLGNWSNTNFVAKGRVKKAQNLRLCLNMMGGVVREVPPVSEPIFFLHKLLLNINFISQWLNFNLVFSSKVCFGLLVWSKMYKY